MDRLLRLRDVSTITGMSRSTIYRRIDDKTFPQPVKVSSFAVRWKESTLSDWMGELSTQKEKINVGVRLGVSPKSFFKN